MFLKLKLKYSNIITFCFLFEYIFKCILFLRFKAEFSASLLQSLVSHNPSEITHHYFSL